MLVAANILVLLTNVNLCNCFFLLKLLCNSLLWRVFTYAQSYPIRSIYHWREVIHKYLLSDVMKAYSCLRFKLATCKNRATSFLEFLEKNKREKKSSISLAMEMDKENVSLHFSSTSKEEDDIFYKSKESSQILKRDRS